MPFHRATSASLKYIYILCAGFNEFFFTHKPRQKLMLVAFFDTCPWIEIGSPFQHHDLYVSLAAEESICI